MRSAAAVQAAGAIPGSLIDQITRDAIRRASMAPTYMEALDITGAALIAVAYLAKAGGPSWMKPSQRPQTSRRR